MKIYTYEKIDNLPEEDVWLEEDHVLSNIEYSKKWAAEKGLEDEYAEENNRNFEPYICKPYDGTKLENDERNVPYTRVRFERRHTLRYYEVRSVEEFLVEHPSEEVLYERKHFFHKTWMD